MKRPALRSPKRGYAEVLLRLRTSQWIVPVLVFVSLNLVLLGNLLPKPVEMSEGQVAKRDVEAPRRVTNRYRTDLLREEAAKAAVREAAALASNYEINQAAAINAEELVGNIFRVLRGEEIQTGCSRRCDCCAFVSNNRCSQAVPEDDLGDRDAQ
jgi:membrane-associated HD superfamily phosphohydrolase